MSFEIIKGILKPTTKKLSNQKPNTKKPKTKKARPQETFSSKGIPSNTQHTDSHPGTLAAAPGKRPGANTRYSRKI